MGEGPAVTVDNSGRVAIMHAVGRVADEQEATYGLLSDGERTARLFDAVDAIYVAGQMHGATAQAEALIGLAAEATLWAEALQAGARR